MKPHPNFFTLGRDCVVLLKCPFEMTLQQRAVFAVYSKLNYVEHVAYPNDTKLDFRSVLSNTPAKCEEDGMNSS